MALRGWSWDAAIGPAGLGDRPLLEALAAAIPDAAVEAAIEATGARERRRRSLPTHLVVTRVVALIETGTHAICDAVLRPFRCGEAPAALRLLRSVGPGMLLLWDRGFYSYAMIRATLARRSDFLGRTKSNVVLRPIEVLADGSFLARVYPTPAARRRHEA